MSWAESVIVVKSEDFEYAKKMVDFLRDGSRKKGQLDIVVQPRVVALAHDDKFYELLEFMQREESKAVVDTYVLEKEERKT